MYRQEGKMQPPIPDPVPNPERRPVDASVVKEYGQAAGYAYIQEGERFVHVLLSM